MRVIIPSTSGWTVVDRSDRSVAMNSDASSICDGASVTTLTADAGGPAGAPCAGELPRQAALSSVKPVARMRADATCVFSDAMGNKLDNGGGAWTAMSARRHTGRSDDERVHQRADVFATPTLVPGWPVTLIKSQTSEGEETKNCAKKGHVNRGLFRVP